MRQLNSSNLTYTTVAVTVRGDEENKIIMPRSTGDPLMRYLASDNASKHVILTDVYGKITEKHTSEIKSVDPMYYTDRKELGPLVPVDDRTTFDEVPDDVRLHRIEQVRKLKEQFMAKKAERNLE